MIRTVTIQDTKSIGTIYNNYIQYSIATFEEEPVSHGEMEKRITAHPPNLPWIVMEEEGKVIGYAYANAWSGRSAYRYSVESTIYLSPEETNKGYGKILYSGLIDELREGEYHCIFSGISLPNPGSIALHESLGFEKVAHLKEVGRKFEKWIDVGYWQLVL